MDPIISSHCLDGECVEVIITDEIVQVRATNQNEALDFTYAEWRAFLLGVRDGEFDLPDA